MDNLYKISISVVESNKILATATVEVSDNWAKIVEVHAEVSENYVVPTELAAVDFSVLVRTASLLAGNPMLDEPGDVTVTVSVAQEEEADEESANVSESPGNEKSSDEMAPSEVEQPDHGNRSVKTDMPSDFGVTYWRLGSIAKVAKHYGVPHRIAQDWIRSLQREGKVASPWPKKAARPYR
ncbi:hypothetical protein OG203_34865 [Nocardia sp. NBC_01499]|uniref:hypothetical protein n=1 Tax=Nocardia sp. NBC_01499 TaxID=2903597 RepID=UPI00386C63A3